MRIPVWEQGSLMDSAHPWDSPPAAGSPGGCSVGISRGAEKSRCQWWSLHSTVDHSRHGPRNSLTIDGCFICGHGIAMDGISEKYMWIRKILQWQKNETSLKHHPVTSTPLLDLHPGLPENPLLLRAAQASLPLQVGMVTKWWRSRSHGTWRRRRRRHGLEVTTSDVDGWTSSSDHEHMKWRPSSWRS